jgi:mono/diheme cytochrome c family protein
MRRPRAYWILIGLFLLLAACAQDEPIIPTPVLNLTTPTMAGGGDAPTPGNGAATPQANGEAALSTPTPLSDVQLISMGAQVYREYCASCHQANGEGNATYPPLNNNPVITSDDPAPAIALVLHGRGQMPAFQEILSAEQIAAVLSYTRNAWDNRATTVSVAEVLARGAVAAAGQPRMTAIPTATGVLTFTVTVTATPEMTSTVTAAE